jgi:hypothetical protein
MHYPVKPQMTLKWATNFNCLISQAVLYCLDKKKGFGSQDRQEYLSKNLL